jgi:maltose alpha-D-glucosyltransferase/alpha-amylase
MDPVYGYQGLNVESQERAPFSLLNWMKRMIGLRKQSKVFGRGSIDFLPAQNRKVLAYVRRYEGETVLCVANLARSVQPVELDLTAFKGMTPVEMLGLTEFPRIGELPYVLTLGPYAFYWFRLQEAPAAVTARVAPGALTDARNAPGLFVGAAWETLLEGNVRTLVERDLLLPFLQRQRWFGGKARQARSARFVDWGVLRRGLQPLFMTIVEVEFTDGDRDQYFLPLSIAGHAEARGVEERAPYAVLANITGARKGLLFDGWLDDRFAKSLLEALDAEEQTVTKRGTIRGLRTDAFADLIGPAGPALRVSRSSADQSNTSIIYGDRLILKLFRRLQPGVNPDYEIGRQLTEKAGFTRVPRIAGALEYARLTEQPSTLAMMQQLVPSQGDGWTHTTDEVQRFYEDVEGTTAPDLPAFEFYTDLIDAPQPDAVTQIMGPSLAAAEILGRRTAEMHVALASDSSNLAFAPEPFTKEDLAAVSAGIMAEAQRALQTLEFESVKLPDEVAEGAARLLQSRDTLLARIRSAPTLEFAASKIRVHGDYHLGQVLWAEGDYIILDFEGEPARPVEQRRMKQSPLKDVAGMIRSFSYAAYAGLFGHVASRPSERERLEPWARIWQTWTTAAFLRGYFTSAAGSLFIPAASSQRDALLRLFVLEKALYELNYELNNRPDWVRIPLKGIFELLGGAVSQDSLGEPAASQ